ncbi:MAG: DUF5009 domain-containing protein [Cyclobacteriaceae bacterium]|nr:DUF5009 domain-containing protein [Cyclobacteriaceae bacterium]
MTGLKNRYLSLDVFRGLDVALMIIVNSPGQGSTSFSPLMHAEWHGFTLTDLVFPTFLFVVGNSMSFSLPKYESMGDGAFLKKVLKRALIIFLLGFLMYWFPFFENGAMKPFAETRIFGVLQRIALCYFFGSIIIHYFKTNGAIYFGIFALLVYQVILALFGDLSMAGNAGSKLDLLLFSESHLYHGEGVVFEPEGLLSTLPSIVNVIIGFIAGAYLQRNGKNFETIAKMLMVGAAFVVIALGWDLVFPINKKLWTSSFVMLTTGIDLIVLSSLVYILDMGKKIKWSYFFEVFGKNTLFIYILSEVFVISLYLIQIDGTSAFRWIADHFFISWMGDYMGSLGFALWIMLTCWLVGYILDKKKIYIKV